MVEIIDILLRARVMGITFHTMLSHLVGHRSQLDAQLDATSLSFAFKLRGFTKMRLYINPQAHVAFSATPCDLPYIIFKNAFSN